MEKERKEIAQKLLRQGVEVAIISETTGLSEEEILKLNNKEQ